MYYIGIDSGGTHMRLGIVSQDGEILADKFTESPLKKHQGIGDIIKSQVNQLISEKDMNFSEIKAVGIGVPGPLDLEAGTILKAANLGNDKPIQLKKELEEAFSLPVFLDRDTNASLRGEAWKGSAEGLSTAIMLTLGTGVGGAIMIDGKIHLGQSGKAGEMGHIFLKVPELVEISANDQTPRCGFGHRGCFEAFIQRSHDIEKIGFYLGYELADLVDIFNPEKILIGGGKLNHGDFLPIAVEIMKEHGIKPAVDEVSVEYAILGELSGVIGAAKLAMDSM